MSLFIRLTLTAAAVQLLASCGGGSAGAPPQPSSGWVVDGYLRGATVLCDSNGNGIADTGELTVTTDAGGRYTFAAPGCADPLTAVGGTDVDTALVFKGWMKAPAGATVITPLTTLMVGGASAERVIAALGLDAATNVPQANPSLDPVLKRKSLVVAQLLLKTTEVFAGLGGVTADAPVRAIYGEVATAFAILLQGGGTLLSGTNLDQGLVAALVKAAAQRVAQSAAVDGAIKTALTALNADALGVVVAGGMKAQAEHILKSADTAIASAASAAQRDGSITAFVKDHLAQLTAAPNSATAALAATLAEAVKAGLTTVPAQPATLPISFDGATSVAFLGFNGAEGTTVEAGPAGGDGKALRIFRLGGDAFAGAFVSTTALPLAADRKTFTARVYSPKAGIRMVLKLEGAGGLSSPEFNPSAPVIEGWQTLTWVATGIDLGKTYTQLTLLPNLGVVEAAPGQAYYVDDITLVADATTPPPATNPALPIDFDAKVPTDLGQFGAGAALSIAAGPAGGTGNAMRFTKSAGDTWAGFYFRTATIPFTATSRTITARVHSTKAGAPMVMKVEGPGGATTAEFAATPATVVGWQTLTWVFTDVDPSKTYNSIAIIPDSGNVGAGQTYHVDEVALVADSGAPGPVAGVPLPISFDETTPPALGQFGAGAAVTVAAGPTGGSGNAARFTKSAGDTWAGFYFPTATIPFTATSRTITARVHSPKAGAPMVMKVEGPGGASSAEIPATPATVVGWQTLRWTFTGLDLGKTYNSIAIIPDSGTVGSGQVYHFDDVTLVPDAVAPPPPNNYLALVADSISLVNGSSRVDYKMQDFESEAGISVSWPIPSPMLMKVSVKEIGVIDLPTDLKVTAAVSITETVPSGKGEIQAYIDNVSVRKTAAGLEISVPTTAADARVYSVSSDGSKKLVIDFANGVAGVKNTLTTAPNMTNSIVFGEVVQYAINQISNSFSGLYSLRGKYKVTVVLKGLPLRRADGTELPALTVVVPTVLNSTGGVEASKPVTGVGISGYITLTN